MSLSFKRKKSTTKHGRPRKVTAVARGRLAGARFGGVAVVPRAPNVERQLRALIASKKKDATDIERNINYVTTSSHSLACLSSSQAAATAPISSGLLAADADEVLINYVRLKGEFIHSAAAVTTPAGQAPTRVRKMVVWFKKPLLVASAAGTLPPITEVLAPPMSYIRALAYQAPQNGGRFKILSDKSWIIGQNWYNTTLGNAGQSGTNRIAYDYTVKVNKMCKFAKPSTDGTSSGGHYSSSAEPGQVTNGLLVMYTICDQATEAQLVEYCTSRLNYTG